VSPEAKRRPPYLPFLQGPPDFAPRLSPIPEARWLFPDSEAEHIMARRLLMATRPVEVMAGDLRSPACEEAYHLIADGAGRGMGRETDPPLQRAARLVSDDLVLLEQGPPGDWRMRSAIVTAPTYWRLPELINMDLGALHQPVPGGDPGLASRIARVFTSLAPDRILERFNWTVQAGAERFTPQRPSARGGQPEDLHLRVERQTVRKLPDTGAVLFTIRICLDPLTAMLEDAETREAFEDAWITAPDHVRAYKGWNRLESLVRKACRRAGQSGLYRPAEDSRE